MKTMLKTLDSVVLAAFGVAMGIGLAALPASGANATKERDMGESFGKSNGIPRLSVFVNQGGYNLGESKRFTCPGAADGTPFRIFRQPAPSPAAPAGSPLFEGRIRGEVGDFTDFNPPASTDLYVIEVEGKDLSPSFWVVDHLMEKLSSRLAYQFFIDVRGGTDPKISPTKITGGGPSRDGGGQGLEALFELLFYASNPALFDRWTTERIWEDRNPANTPDLIELILWHAAFCYDKIDYTGRSTSEHPRWPDYAKWRDFGYEGQERQGFDRQNMLDQLAAVCAAYHSFLKPFMDEPTYRAYRKACLDRWEKYDRQNEVRYWVRSSKWTDPGFKEFSEQGSAFGQGLMRNMMMYICEKNEPGGQPEKFLKYAQACAQDIIKNWDFNNSWHMWAARNAEHITPQALGLFLLLAPEQAPAGTKEKLEAYRNYLAQRTDNLWQYRTHSDTEWAHPKSKEIGTVSGLAGSMFLTAQLLGDAKLRAMGWSQIDFIFGRNPIGCHTSNKSDARVAKGGYWEGIEHGWPWHLERGTGDLGLVRGTLDGSPVNAAFPFNQTGTAAGPYATEGWAITNRAWMSALTFSTLGSHQIRSLDASGNPITTAKSGQTITVELKAALNQDWEKPETGWVDVTIGSTAPKRLTVTETGPNTGLFTASYKLEVPVGTSVLFSYGYWGLGKTAKVACVDTSAH